MFCVDRLFREDAVVGKLTFQASDDQVVRDRVGLGDWLDVVGVIFLFDIKRTFIMLEDRSTRHTRQLARNTQLKFKVLTRVHPCKSAAKFLPASRTTSIVSSMSAFVVRKFVMHARNANFPFTVAFDKYARPPFCTVSMIFSLS